MAVIASARVARDVILMPERTLFVQVKLWWSILLQGIRLLGLLNLTYSASN